MRFRSAQDCRIAGVTYHLVPEPVWDERGGDVTYLPEAYDADGFIHCTNGLDPLLTVGNMFYTDDRRPYSVLVLEMDRIQSDVRYDDPDEMYPHIYGPLNTDAVVGSFKVIRDTDGSFTGFEKA